MAQKVTVVLEDDLTCGPAGQTIRFAFEGTDDEIGLNPKNAATFSKQLAPILRRGSPYGLRMTGNSVRPRSTSPSP